MEPLARSSRGAVTLHALYSLKDISHEIESPYDTAQLSEIFLKRWLTMLAEKI